MDKIKYSDFEEIKNTVIWACECVNGFLHSGEELDVIAVLEYKGLPKNQKLYLESVVYLERLKKETEKFRKQRNLYL